MKTVSIQMRQWLGANERKQVLPSDLWYLDFAIKLLPIVKESNLFTTEREQVGAAISLCMYFQDAIAQTGGWKIFSEAYYALYKTHLPFYSLSDEYVADEINMEDIAFVLWTLKSRPALWEDEPYTIYNPFDDKLIGLGRLAYNLMDEAFEEAPICEVPSSAMWVMGPDLLEIPITPLPEVTPETKLKKDVEHCLEYNDGKPLLYFATYQDLCKFFVDVLKWENKPSSLLPDLEKDSGFVVYANAKGMLVAPNIAAFFCEPHNPMYDAERAKAKGYELFCCQGLCPFDLLKYGMMKDVLPEVQFAYPNGKEVLHKNWDFIARYYLGEYYEGL